MNPRTCHCGKPAATGFQHLGPLCRDCFCSVICRRCRKALKDSGWVKKGQKVHLSSGRRMQDNALRPLFRQVVKNLPVSHVSAQEADVIIASGTADDKAEEFLQRLFSGRAGRKCRETSLFAGILTAEIEEYCRLNRIEGSPAKRTWLGRQLESLNNKYPGIIFSLQKSSRSFGQK